MATVELLVAFLAITAGLVFAVVWFSKASAKAEERERFRRSELLRQRRLARRLARRQRDRDDVVEWMRSRSDD